MKNGSWLAVRWDWSSLALRYTKLSPVEAAGRLHEARRDLPPELKVVWLRETGQDIPPELKALAESMRRDTKPSLPAITPEVRKQMEVILHAGMKVRYSPMSDNSRGAADDDGPRPGPEEWGLDPPCPVTLQGAGKPILVDGAPVSTAKGKTYKALAAVVTAYPKLADHPTIDKAADSPAAGRLLDDLLRSRPALRGVLVRVGSNRPGRPTGPSGWQIVPRRGGATPKPDIPI
jgi:hypothetical protein